MALPSNVVILLFFIISRARYETLRSHVGLGASSLLQVQDAGFFAEWAI